MVYYTLKDYINIGKNKLSIVDDKNNLQLKHFISIIVKALIIQRKYSYHIA